MVFMNSSIFKGTYKVVYMVKILVNLRLTVNIFPL